jgi:hypothetical protein
VRWTLLGAAVVWIFFTLAHLRNVVSFYDRREPLAMGVEEVHLNWPSNTIYPHALAVTGDRAFAANRYQVFSFSANGGDVSQVACNLPGTITDVSAQCDNAGNCWPLVLVGGHEQKVVNCRTGEELPLLPDLSKGAPRFIAHRGGDSTTMMAMALPHNSGSAVLDYSSAQASEWRPVRERAQLDGAAAVTDFDYWGHLLYLVERQSARHPRHVTTGRVRIVDMESLEPVGAWTLPQQFLPLAAGSLGDRSTLFLLPEGRAPSLLKWTIPEQR